METDLTNTSMCSGQNKIYKIRSLDKFILFGAVNTVFCLTLNLVGACLLLSAGDRNNIILKVPRSNHKEWGKFKDNVIKKKQFG